MTDYTRAPWTMDGPVADVDGVRAPGPASLPNGSAPPRSDAYEGSAVQDRPRLPSLPPATARRSDPVPASVGVVGGGGGPGVELPGWAVALPERLAAALRTGADPVVGRIERGRCLLDLRCVPADADDRVIAAVVAASAPG